MKRSLTGLGLGALAAMGLAAGLATAGLSTEPGPPNQGDPDKVLTVASGYTCSGTITWADKVEGGGLGPVIDVTSATPIVKVTIKSGSKAVLVTATWAADYRSGRIEISQDVSNYVVWSCSGGTTTTTDTTPTTTTTQTTDTTPVTTTTDTTPTTTDAPPPPTTTEGETAPAVTETTPSVPLTPPALPTKPTTPTMPTKPTKPAGATAPADQRAGPSRPPAPLTPPATPAAQAQPELAYTP